VPPPGAIDAWYIWYQLMVSTGAFVCALAPVCAVARLASARRKPKVPAPVATSANALYQYRLQHEMVLLAWIFGSFSSSVWAHIITTGTRRSSKEGGQRVWKRCSATITQN